MFNIMKNWWKIAIAMIVSGTVLFGLSFALGARGGYAYVDGGGLKFSSASEAAAQASKISLEPFETVDVDVSSADIEFVASDGYGIEYRLPAFADAPEWNVAGGKLTVRTPSNGFYWTFMDFGFQRHYVKVYFPRGGASFGSVSITTKSGDIVLAELPAGDVSLKTNSGTVKADVLGYKRATAQTSSGDITFRGGGADGAAIKLSAMSGDIKADASGCASVDLETASGQITLSGDTPPHAELKAATKSGGITVDASQWKSLAADATSGDVMITGKPQGSTTAKAMSGNVTMAIRGEARDFSYDISAASGSVRVDGQRMGNSARNANSGAKNTIDANTFSGNVSLDFN